MSEQQQSSSQAGVESLLPNLDAINISNSHLATSLLKAKVEEKTVSFKCGDDVMEIKESDLPKIPYLETLAAGSFQEGPDSAEVIQLSNSCDPKLMKVVLTYIKRDRIKCLFTELPDESSPSSIFTLLDFLLMKKPTSTLSVLDDRMKNIKSSYDKYERMNIANRPGARDACVELCWLMHSETTRETKDIKKLYNLILYVVSHPRTYYPARLRSHVLSWYLDNFQTTPKQKEILRGWETRGSVHNHGNYLESDETSSGGSFSPEEYYNSDYDDDYCGYSS